MPFARYSVDLTDIVLADYRTFAAILQMGITDYSLLVGVRNLSYDVDPEGMLYKRYMLD